MRKLCPAAAGNPPCDVLIILKKNLTLFKSSDNPWRCEHVYPPLFALLSPPFRQGGQNERGKLEGVYPRTTRSLRIQRNEQDKANADLIAGSLQRCK